ncbi:MAG: hypothetical protein FJ090_07045 [Deltaproteobacteria bacterium]|nr:hypothetical protein [Deltaproteobacteria bacterium]MBM4390863.1 hypothetical protein [Deltaproteobacteria bacterium]
MILITLLLACAPAETTKGSPQAHTPAVTALADATDAELESVVYAIGSGSAQAAQAMVELAELDATTAESEGLAPCPSLQVADDGLTIATGSCTSALTGNTYTGSFTERGLGIMGGEVEDTLQARLDSTGFELTTSEGHRGSFAGTAAIEIGSDGSRGSYDLAAEYGQLPPFRNWGEVDCPEVDGAQVCDESSWHHHVEGLGVLRISDEADGSPWRVDGASDGMTITAPDEGQDFSAEFDDGSTRVFRVFHAEDLVRAASAALGD